MQSSESTAYGVLIIMLLVELKKSRFHLGKQI
jgi:hypothetical protein